MCGPPTVAVCTSDCALCDFLFNALPPVVCQHLCDLNGLDLGVEMIELQHDRVCLAAIYTRMEQQIGLKSAAILGQPLALLRTDKLQVSRLVIEIMATIVLTLAFFAIRVVLTRQAVHPVKRLLRFRLMAADANFDFHDSPGT
jgi:hypothetical protein